MVPPAAPASYTLTLPVNGPLDAADLALVSEMGRARGWSNEQAQAVLGEMAEGLTTQHQAFTTELEAHPDIGGVRLAPARERATRVLDRFLPASLPDGAKLRAVLTKSGYDNYAPFVRLLDAIGASMSEDRPIAAPPGGPAPARKPTTEVLFGSAAPAAPRS